MQLTRPFRLEPPLVLHERPPAGSAGGWIKRYPKRVALAAREREKEARKESHQLRKQRKKEAIPVFMQKANNAPTREALFT